MTKHNEDHITIEELARVAGVPERTIARRIESAGIDGSNICYVHDKGYVGKMPKGTEKILYVIKTSSGQTAYFGTQREILNDMTSPGNPEDHHEDFHGDVDVSIPKRVG